MVQGPSFGSFTLRITRRTGEEETDGGGPAKGAQMQKVGGRARGRRRLGTCIWGNLFASCGDIWGDCILSSSYRRPLVHNSDLSTGQGTDKVGGKLHSLSVFLNRSCLLESRST